MQSHRSAADQSTDRLATVVQAAEFLGITPDAVRSRLRRGTLQRAPVRGEEGEVLVVLPNSTRADQSANQSETVGNQSSDASADQATTDRETVPTVALIESLQDQIDRLSHQLDEANRANAEHRRLLAAALERIPAIEAPQEHPGDERDGHQTASESSGNGEGRAGALEPTERRSWLYRFFFGP